MSAPRVAHGIFMQCLILYASTELHGVKSLVGDGTGEWCLGMLSVLLRTPRLTKRAQIPYMTNQSMIFRLYDRKHVI